MLDEDYDINGHRRTKSEFRSHNSTRNDIFSAREKMRLNIYSPVGTNRSELNFLDNKEKKKSTSRGKASSKISTVLKAASKISTVKN